MVLNTRPWWETYFPFPHFFPPPSCHGYALNELKWWLIKRKCLLDGRTRHPCVVSMWIKPLWRGGTLLVFVTRVYANTRLLSPGSVSRRERSCCALQISLSLATNLLTFTVINFHCVSASLPCHDGYLFDFAGRMFACSSSEESDQIFTPWGGWSSKLQ